MTRRKVIQWLTALGYNVYIPGFFKGRIYRGVFKAICVPGLNCYSCPGAVASCPLGALQAVIGASRYSFSYYAAGLLLTFGLLFGRIICGFLCPFGLLQELLNKIPFFRSKRGESQSNGRSAGFVKFTNYLKYVKYIILLVFVLALPLLTKEDIGVGQPAFCKYICPAGTLTAGAPLLAANAPMRETLGWLFALKTSIALFTIIGCVMTYRFFCKFLCPLGAFYGLFNRIALYQIRLREDRCVRCGCCVKICRMAVDPSLDPNSAECVRCGDCVKACPTAALTAGFRAKYNGCAKNTISQA
jgi:polyferredoxin